MTMICEWETLHEDVVAGIGSYLRAGRVPLRAQVRRSDVGFAWLLLDPTNAPVARGVSMRFEAARCDAFSASGRFCEDCGKRWLDDGEEAAMDLAERIETKRGGDDVREAWARARAKFCRCDDNTSEERKAS